ncbi:alanine racemase [Thermodesulfobacteriota bacterium]
MINSPNTLTIDLKSLEFNLAQIKKHVGKGTKIMGIVKSDAYGHGLVRVSRELEENGIYCLGVSFVSEAILLRNEGIKIPIIVLCGIETREEADAAIENDLTPVVFDVDSTEMLEKAAVNKGKMVNIHIKLDTGMGRLGIDFDETVTFLKEIMKFKSLNPEGLLSHLSSADEDDHSFTEKQVENFRNAVNDGRHLGMELKLNHHANSAGIMAHDNSYFDLVRPGIILYGGLPCPGYKPPFELKPVMEFKGRILQIRNFKENTPVSYGRTYYTSGQKQIAIISVGYADGLPRNLSNRGKVLAGGKKADITGSVCMNMLACDVTGINDLKPGDECVIMGSQGDETITVDDIAEWCDTISYEILLSIGRASEKKYIS